MSGSTGYNFVAGTPARATEVNKNFEFFRGHYLPVTQSGTWANTTVAYDLGSGTARWRTLYLADTTTAFDGATGAIVNAMIGTNAIGGTKIDKTPNTTGTQDISAGASWTPTAGIYQIVTTTANIAPLSLYISSAWRTGTIALNAIVFCDGTNMRLTDAGGGSTVYYQTF